MTYKLSIVYVGGVAKNFAQVTSYKWTKEGVSKLELTFKNGAKAFIPITNTLLILIDVEEEVIIEEPIRNLKSVTKDSVQ